MKVSIIIREMSGIMVLKKHTTPSQAFWMNMVTDKDLKLLYLKIHNQKMNELFEKPSICEDEVTENDWYDFWYNEDV